MMSMEKRYLRKDGSFVWANLTMRSPGAIAQSMGSIASLEAIDMVSQIELEYERVKEALSYLDFKF